MQVRDQELRQIFDSMLPYLIDDPEKLSELATTIRHLETPTLGYLKQYLETTISQRMAVVESG